MKNLETLVQSGNQLGTNKLNRRGFLLALGAFMVGCKRKEPEKILPEKINYPIIFAGHTESLRNKTNNQGARSYYGRLEYEFNDNIVHLFPELKNNKINYEIIPAKSNMPLTRRPQYALDRRSDVYIEIHHDSAQEADIKRLRGLASTQAEWSELSGFSVLYSSTNKFSGESKTLASLIGQELVKKGFKPNHYHAKDIEGERRKLVEPENGVYDYDKSLFVLREAKMPAVIVECGVIVNPYEEANLRQSQTQRKIATAIDRALTEYFSEVKGGIP